MQEYSHNFILILHFTHSSVLQCSLQYNSQETSIIENKVDNSDAETGHSDADTDG